MSGEPASTTVGGFAAWKLGAALLGVGVVASALGFLVLLPKTAKEAAMRTLATMIGSAIFGPFLVIAAYGKWPELFSAGTRLAAELGMEPWAGLFVTGAPLLAMGGLPVWWILGALLRWFEKRKGHDIVELAKAAKQALK